MTCCDIAVSLSHDISCPYTRISSDISTPTRPLLATDRDNFPLATCRCMVRRVFPVNSAASEIDTMGII
ncbi:hypothetical protein [Commensalibacter papalotli (ex Servin-Garciduenas et al. 2014)]|uniref:hypothetical protein n=1 Tax=Commensalibacter papalotli (ex Servin-Garciduenas et al. 2014) TaxID=1208583 RepID=UPI0012693A08|nr:hypothetical protein [Commensalibacter papalotli (ex Servin-Garciduenas et al. 2014)]